MSWNPPAVHALPDAFSSGRLFAVRLMCFCDSYSAHRTRELQCGLPSRHFRGRHSNAFWLTRVHSLVKQAGLLESSSFCRMSWNPPAAHALPDAFSSVATTLLCTCETNTCIDSIWLGIRFIVKAVCFPHFTLHALQWCSCCVWLLAMEMELRQGRILRRA